MNKFFFFFIFSLLISLFVIQQRNLLYFPSDILNLFQLFHQNNSQIPHNTLVSDPVFQFEPWRHYTKELILSGQFPLWNDLNASGVPLFANSQSAVLFPLNILYYIFPVSISINLIPLLKIILLALFSYLYLRTLNISKEVSFLGGMLISFSGFPLVWLLWPHTNTYIFLPLFLFIIEKIINSKNSHRWYFLLSISFCSAIFGGHYETLLHILFLYIFYLLFRIRFNLIVLTKIGLFTILGIFLASIQLVPFLEYFINSYAQSYRVHSSGLYLPIESFVLNIFPFLMGAPHAQFYKPITASTNFQESVGGYIGLVSLLISLIGGTLLFKKNEIKFWVFCSIIFWLLAFKIWPLGVILELPILSQVQNSRFSSIAGFSTLMIVIFSIENYKYIIKSFIDRRGNIVLFLLSFFIVFTVSILILPSLLGISHPFIPILKDHLIFIMLTTTTFLIVVLYFFDIFGKKGVLLTVLLFLISQTLFLFFTYIPFLSKNYYYPTNPLIERLGKEKLTVLEVGNPSIAPNINLLYGIKSAQNYDALEIKTYKEAFDAAFPIKNHWDKVDKVELKNLNKFGINYILSDYNLNDYYQRTQPRVTSILGPLTKDRVIRLYFKPAKEILNGIRLLPANYNRKNSCILTMQVFDIENKTVIYSKKISCSELLDKMFYTIKIPNISLDKKKEFVFEFTSESEKDNSIGLWGENNRPFAELFYSSENKPTYELIDTYNNVNLFKVPNSQMISLHGNFYILNQTTKSMIIKYNAVKDTDIKIKKVFYPGWNAAIDSKPVELIYDEPFMKIKTSKGDHILELSYEPLSFVVGTVISFISLIILLIYFLRNEFNMRIWQNFQKEYYKRNANNLKNISSNILIITAFTLSGICLSIFLVMMLPKTFTFGFVSTINWLIVNQHSILRDNIIFGLFSLMIPLTFLLGWLFILWRKKI